MFKFWYAILFCLVLIMILDHWDHFSDSWKLQLMIFSHYLWYLMAENVGFERVHYIIIIQLLEMARSLKLKNNKQFRFG